MRYLILSDIHANWEGLEAALEHAAGKYDKVLCCGDLIGYGADPNPVIEWVRTHAAGVVRGNHDKASVGLDDLEWFNPVARAAAVWTQHELTLENAEYVRNLPRGPLTFEGFQMVHGSPLDEDEYVVTERDVEQLAPYLDSEVSFFGHTHLQGGFQCHRNGVVAFGGVDDDAQDRAVELETDVSYLINPGSVGQPRDGDWRAAYAVYQPETRLVTLYRAEYDVASAQKKILKAGLPELLAARLEAGV